MKFKEIIRFFKRYFKQEKTLLIKSFIFIFISSLLGVLYGYLIGEATQNATESHFFIAVMILLFYLFMALLDNLIFNRLGKICIKKACSNIMERISYDVYYKVGLLPARAFEEKTSGELINRVVNDSATITETFQQFVRVITVLFTALLIWFILYIF